MKIEESQEIEIVNGDGSELNISPVKEHLNVAKPKSKEEKDKKGIVIPSTRKIHIDMDEDDEYDDEDYNTSAEDDDEEYSIIEDDDL